MPHEPPSNRDRHVIIEGKSSYLIIRCLCKARYVFYDYHDSSMKGFAMWRARERRACFVDASDLDLFVCRCGYVIFDERPVGSTLIH